MHLGDYVIALLRIILKPKKLRPGPGTHSPGQYPTVPGMPHVSLPSHLPGAADLAQTQQALFHAHQQAYLQQVSPLQPQSHQVCVTNRCHKVKQMVSHLLVSFFKIRFKVFFMERIKIRLMKSMT